MFAHVMRVILYLTVLVWLVYKIVLVMEFVTTLPESALVKEAGVAKVAMTKSKTLKALLSEPLWVVLVSLPLLLVHFT